MDAPLKCTAAFHVIRDDSDDDVRYEMILLRTDSQEFIDLFRADAETNSLMSAITQSADMAMHSGVWMWSGKIISMGLPPHVQPRVVGRFRKPTAAEIAMIVGDGSPDIAAAVQYNMGRKQHRLEAAVLNGLCDMLREQMGTATTIFTSREVPEVWVSYGGSRFAGGICIFRLVNGTLAMVCLNMVPHTMHHMKKPWPVDGSEATKYNVAHPESIQQFIDDVCKCLGTYDYEKDTNEKARGQA